MMRIATLCLVGSGLALGGCGATKPELDSSSTPTATTPAPAPAPNTPPPSGDAGTREEVELARANCISTDSDGGETTYDEFGWVSMYDSGDEIEVWNYTRSGGRVVSAEVVRGGDQHRHTYDEKSNLTEIFINEVIDTVCTWTYTGDRKEGESTCVDSTGTSVVTYDPCGYYTDISGDLNIEQDLTYRDRCFLSSAVVTVPDLGFNSINTYDTHGRLVGVSSDAGGATSSTTFSWDCD